MKKFRFIFKEWASCPYALILLVSTIVLDAVGAFLASRLAILIPTAIEEPATDVITRLAVFAILYIISSSLVSICIGYFRTNIFIYEYNKFIGKCSEIDYRAYAKNSPAAIETASEFIHYIAKYGIVLGKFINAIISLVILFVTIFTINRTAMFIFIPIYIAASILVKLLFNKFDSIDKVVSEARKSRNQTSFNIISGFQEVRTFGTAKREVDKIKDMSNIDQTSTKKKMRITCFVDLILNSTSYISIGIVIFLIQYGAIDAILGLALANLSDKFVYPLLNIIDIINDLSDGSHLYELYSSIMNYENQIIDGDINLDETIESIDMENVSFSYDSSNQILESINLSFKKGEKIGICGASGGGKSTIFKLLNRFYDPEEGSIKVNGIDLKKLSLQSYRKRVKAVHQENELFPGTIKENLLYGSPHSTDDKIIEACKKANIYDFIMGLENRFDTDIGPKGIKLSGGERQRIAIARVLLTKPEVLLLDEATSALDNESEKLIQEAIYNLNCTVIMIAHRLTTIKNCDKIVVVGNHGILEEGNHNELLDKKGEYYKMAKLIKR